MRYVIAIDVGIKNLGFCVFDFVSATFVHWENVELAHGRYMPMQNVKYVHDFVDKFRYYFENSACVLVERQMRCNMRIVESIFHSLFYDRCIIINPRTLKLHYGLGTRNYRTNKQRAVEWAEAFIHANPKGFESNVIDPFKNGTKTDDLADSLLLVCYYLETYSNQLSVTPFSIPEDGF